MNRVGLTVAWVGWVACAATVVSGCKGKTETPAAEPSATAATSNAKPVAAAELPFDFYAGPEIAAHAAGGVLGLTLEQFHARWATAAAAHGAPAASLKIDGIYDRGYRDAKADLPSNLHLHGMLVGERELASVVVQAAPYKKEHQEQIFAAWETLIDAVEPGATADDHRAIYQGLGLFSGKTAGAKAVEHGGFRYIVVERHLPAHTELSFKAEPVMKPPAPGTPVSIAVPDGSLPDAGHLETFFALMPPASFGRPFADALALCRAEGLDLCTDPEWRRACEVAPEIGAVETWTSSFTADHAQLQVRGGGSCTSGGGALAAEAKAIRGGLCCTRSIGLTGELSRMRGPSLSVMTYERGTNLKSADLLGRAFSPLLNQFYTTTDVPRETAIQQSLAYLMKDARAYSMHDTCTLGASDNSLLTQLDCVHTTFAGDKAGVTRASYAVGPDGLTYVRDPVILRKSSAY